MRILTGKPEYKPKDDETEVKAAVKWQAQGRSPLPNARLHQNQNKHTENPFLSKSQLDLLCATLRNTNCLPLRKWMMANKTWPLTGPRFPTHKAPRTLHRGPGGLGRALLCRFKLKLWVCDGLVQSDLLLRRPEFSLFYGRTVISTWHSHFC